MALAIFSVAGNAIRVGRRMARTSVVNALTAACYGAGPAWSRFTEFTRYIGSRCAFCSFVSSLLIIPQHWNGSFFQRTSLQALGLRIQLGHGGAPCPNPSPGPRGFCVVSSSGIHHVTVDLCDCGSNSFLSCRTQILRAGWFPATFNRPKTAFTFECLDTFHELTLQGKTTLHDFFQMILNKTDNLRLTKTTVISLRQLTVWVGINLYSF